MRVVEYPIFATLDSHGATFVASRNDIRRNVNRVWVSHHIVIAPMSSEETCLQGFPNDAIFGVIVFAFIQI